MPKDLTKNSIHQSTPGLLITQEFNGAAGPLSPQFLTEDNGCSAIRRANLSAAIVNNQHTLRLSPNRDSMVIGYTPEGPPILVTTRAVNDKHAVAIHAFVQTKILPILNNFAEELARSNNATTVIHHLIEKIEDENLGECEFAMSVAIVYKKNEQLRCAGFGIGDTSLLCQTANGQLEQLTCATYVNHEIDHFGTRMEHPENRRDIIARNHVFDRQMALGDTLIAYTYLPKELRVTTECKEEYGAVARVALDTAEVENLYADLKPTDEPSKSLDYAEHLIRTGSLVVEDHCRQLLQAQQDRTFGEYTTVGSVTIDATPGKEALLYAQEKGRLLDLLTSPTPLSDKIKKAIRAVVDNCDTLKSSPKNLPELTRDLVSCYTAINNTVLLLVMDKCDLENRSQNTFGKPSLGWKRLGLAMIVLAVILGICALIPPVSIALAIASPATLLLGLGVFAYSRQIGGVSNAMVQLDTALTPERRLSV